MPTAEAKDDGAYAADDKGSKGDDAKGVDTSSIDASKSIVDKVSDYFYLDPSFSDGFEQWAMDHCDAIDLSLDEDANKLEYTALYNDFVEMFEGKLGHFIKSQGSTINEFYAEVTEWTAKDANSNAAFLGQVMLATTEYSVFIQMMREMKLQQPDHK